MLVSLGNWEMVLGVQWLACLGPSLWDFEKLKMEFKYGGQRVVLRGTQKSDMEWIGGKRFQQSLHKFAQLFTLQVHPVSVPVSLCVVENPSLVIQQLLNEYTNIFAKPKTFPPHRELDHRILLKPGIAPVHVRPYRYPVLQTNVIEEVVKETVQSGAVRPSHSPYSSPIVLVKKKDGTCRLCVDYRQLNKSTVLDKFFIPVIEELLNELHGSVIYSEIDL